MKMKKEIETCCVVWDNDCLSPANLEQLVPLRTSCYVCGQKVCKNCSKIVYDKYAHHRIRVCFDCLEGDSERFPKYQCTCSHWVDTGHHNLLPEKCPVHSV